MKCPKCGKPMESKECLRGINPNYRREKGWYCLNFSECYFAGGILFADSTPEQIEMQVETAKKHRGDLSGYKRMKELRQKNG